MLCARARPTARLGLVVPANAIVGFASAGPECKPRPHARALLTPLIPSHRAHRAQPSPPQLDPLTTDYTTVMGDVASYTVGAWNGRH